jgi:hypothetical protein
LFIFSFFEIPKNFPFIFEIFSALCAQIHWNRVFKKKSALRAAKSK